MRDFDNGECAYFYENLDERGGAQRSTPVHQPTSQIAIGGSSELDEGEIVGGEFVAAGRDAPTLLNFVEEPLDQVAVPVRGRD